MIIMDTAFIKKLNEQSKTLSEEEIVRLAYKEFSGRINFASSFGEEDQVITDIISKAQPDFEIFTLDTGRLFPETYSLIEKTQKRYPMSIKVFYPDTENLEEMIRAKGINLFYDSIDARKLCCGVRKVEPLKRALKNVDAWMCGLRQEQSVTRTSLEIFSWDEFNQKVKVAPLAKWSLEDVRNYIDKNFVDVNPLHEKGFVSIGCSPCTRAVQEGEDVRSGRWWWEDPEKKECGLHSKGD